MSLIQHLNVIVDPQAPALSDYDPPTTVTGGGNPADATPDPTEAGRNPSGRLVRTGGSGVAGARNRKRKTYARNYNGDATSWGNPTTPPPVRVTLPYDVLAGDLLVAIAYAQCASGGTLAISDSQGNTWTRAGSYQRRENTPVSGLFYYLALFYCTNPAGGPLTVTGQPSGVNATLLAVRAYGGDYNGASLDGTGGNSVAAPASGVMTTGSVTVSGARRLLVGCLNTVMYLYRGLAAYDQAFKQRSFHYQGLDVPEGGDVTPFLFYADVVTDTSGAVTGFQGSGFGFSPAYAPYLGVAASFAPHP